MKERMNLRYTLLLLIGLVSKTFVRAEESVTCHICNGDPNASITIPDGQIPLDFLGAPGVFASCQELFDAGKDGQLLKNECDILLADPTIAVTCGCTSVAAPIPSITPAPVIAPVTPAPVIAPVTPAPIVPAPVTPAPLAAPVTPAPIVPTALETPAPIIPTPPTTSTPIAASVRAPTAASQRVPTLPEQPVSMPTATTRNGTRNRRPPTSKPIRNKPVEKPVVVRKPTRTNPRSRTSNPTKVRPRHNNTPTVVVKVQPRNIAPQSPPTKQKPNDDVSVNSQVQSDNLLSILSIPNSTTVDTNIDNNYHINEVADMNAMAETVETIGDLPSLLVSLDYTDTYKRQELLVKKHDASKTNSE